MVDRDETVERRVRSDRTIKQITSSSSPPLRRSDGKPEVTTGEAVSVAHCGDLTFVIAGSAPLGCDVESVTTKSSAIWQDLLGQERFDLANVVAQENREALDLAATRIWSASECLKKAGAMIDVPLMLLDTNTDDVVWLESGESAIATLVVSVRDFEQPLVFALLVKKPSEQAWKKVRSLDYQGVMGKVEIST